MSRQMSRKFINAIVITALTIIAGSMACGETEIEIPRDGDGLGVT